MLPSKLDVEPGDEIQNSDILTTGRMPVVTSGGGPLTTGRMPVVIPGAKKRLPQTRGTAPVKAKHRVFLHASVVFVLIVFIGTTVVSILPLGSGGKALGLGGLLQNLGVISQTNSNSRNSALVGAEAATATAIMQNDGFDPGSTVSQQFNAAIGMPGANNFPYGQCTWWASQRYHDLTGYWVDWSGNAYQWAFNAPAHAGWVDSPTPHVPSIVVFQPGVQFASPVYGHVAILEAINPDGSLKTSNMNVSGAGFGAVVDLTNYTGPGVSFVYHV